VVIETVRLTRPLRKPALQLGSIPERFKILIMLQNIVNKRKFFGSRGGSCECVCHKRVATNDYCGYCSGSHSRPRRF
jgi:hypothetical protein